MTTLQTWARRLHDLLGALGRGLPAFRGKTRIGRLLTWYLLRRGDVVQEVVLRDGSRMLLDPRSRTEAMAFWNGDFEPDYVWMLTSCVRTGDWVMDVGANVGLIAVPLGRHLLALGQGHLVAFEPVSTNFQRLQQVVGLNGLEGVVDVVNVALGDEDRMVEMALENDWHGVTGNAILQQAAGSVRDAYGAVSPASMRRLDRLAQERGWLRTDLIKVDVEGAEVLFLRGGQDFLQATRPIIFGEFHSAFIREFGTSFEDVVRLVSPWSYRFYAFAGARRLVRLTSPGADRGDVVLVPEEKSAWFESLFVPSTR